MAQKQKKVETSAGQDPLAAMLGNRKSASATDGPAPPPLPGQTNKSSQVGDKGAPKSAKSKVNKPPPPVLKPSGIKKKNTKKPNTEKSSVTGSPIAPDKTSKETLSKEPSVGEKDSSPKANSSVSLSEESASEASPRRVARRRPAGPVRGRIAANDDAPSIGGLIYALEQKPNTKPFRYAGYATIAWCIASLIFGYLILSNRMSEGVTLTGIAQEPLTFFILTTIVVPIAVIWFLALLAWRAEELRLRSSTMTEVAVRLAEPDRMAEQSVATLGQAVRRQVSFMNDAVTQALGRAGELEAMVHNEVTVLEQSYEENERKIRQLIQELSGERHALLNTSERVTTTLRELGNDVPNLIDKLSGQQIKLAQIIQGAGDNLTALETSLSDSADKLETTLGTRTDTLQSTLSEHAKLIDTTLDTRTENMQGMLAQYTGALGEALTNRSEEMQGMLEDYTTALAGALGTRSTQIQKAFETSMDVIDSSMSKRTDNLQAVFEEYGKALDAALANRAENLDTKLIERTKALDEAFNKRLQSFDESIRHSTSAIDVAVTERSTALTNALENHAKTFKEAITLQASDLDESINHGVTAVRRSSENITRQSLQAIEGLSKQSDMLKNVSENLLTQVNTVTNRFESQGQSIMKAANALETANYKIDSTLQNRHAEIAHTLDRLSGKADEFGSFVTGYSSSIEGSISEAEARARQVAEELRSDAYSHQQAALQSMQQIRSQTSLESDRVLEELRTKFASVSQEVATHIGALSSRLDETTEDVRQRAALAAQDIANEQSRLKAQLEQIPVATRENTEAMRVALEDQLRALDQLSALTAREAHTRDIRAPIVPTQESAVRPTSPAPQPNNRTQPVQTKALSSLSSSLNQELQARTHEPSGRATHSQSGETQPRQTLAGQKQAGVSKLQPRSHWSLGDLLNRASLDDDVAANNGFNVDVIAQALDPTTAIAIWSRVRLGGRGVMVRSIYTQEGRVAFDRLSGRIKTDPAMAQAVRQYITDYERIIATSEQQDPSGRLTEQQIATETGRVYLFLAHAAGRIV